MTTSETKLSMKLLIDTKAKKVLFAEVEKNCVDFLFQILSLPVGTVTKFLKEKGMNGCLYNLYESVENLNDTYIQSKDIILKPKYLVGISSVPLPLLNDVPTLTTLYKCWSTTCSIYVTDVSNSICPTCQKAMSRDLMYVAPPVVKGAVANGGFVKDTVYMAMDDLVVKPVSVVSSITGLKEYFNVKDVSVLQEEVVDFGKEEALKLLKSSLESKAVLTSVFLSRVKEEK